MITIVTQKDLIDERKLKIVNPWQLKRDISYCNSLKSDNSKGRKGWSKDKENLSEAAWNPEVYWQVMAIADRCEDPEERDHIRERLIKQFSCFKTR